jgi:two-component system LytT family response regulator
VEGPLSSVNASLKWFAENPAPHLILSDIQLSDGISFDIFEKGKIKSPIIFTTAYDAYAVRAFKLNSIDYLLKPIDEKELKAGLMKYKSLAFGDVVADQWREFMSRWGETPKKYKDRFLAVHGHALVPVPVSEVAFFHKEELIFLHTRKQEKMISEHPTLDEIEHLVDPALFFRVNRQYLINVDAIARIRTTHKGLTVQLKSGGTELEVSREKATAFKKWAEGRN